MVEGDRRKYLRKSCLVKVVLRLGRETWSGTILNYSEGGVYVATKRRIAIGDTLRLRFRRPVSGRIADLEGIVKRTVKLGDPGEPEPGFAVQFIEILSRIPDASGASGVFPVGKGDSGTGKPSIEVDQISSPTIDRPAPADPAPADTGEGEIAATTREHPATRPRLLAREDRSVVDIEVTFIPHTGSSPPLLARVTNLSRGGMYLATDSPPQIDSVLTVRFEGADVDGQTAALEVVVQSSWASWQRPHQDLSKGVGCRIVGYHSNKGRRRFERLLKSLLLIGSPIFKDI